MRRFLPFLPALLLLASCGDSTGPGSEPVALRITAPATAPAGTPFALTVEAEGADGAAPVVSVNGVVDLAVSDGTIAPDAATLVDGAVTLEVTLSVADGPVEITATRADLVGSATVTVGAPRVLPGDPARPAVENIPDLEYVPDPDDYAIPHPGMEGPALSHRVLLVALDPTATTGDVNGLLSGLDAVIAGGIPGIAGTYSGLLVLRLPFADHAGMDSLRAELANSPLVRAAVPDGLEDIERVPPSAGNDSRWVWDAEPAGGNWGFETARVPQMWNLEPALDRRQVSPVPFGMVDSGVAGHVDLVVSRLTTPSFPDSHGTHVAGTMVARRGKGGVDGITRHGTLFAAEVVRGQITNAVIQQRIAVLVQQGVRVINISLGKKWKGVDPTSSPAWERYYEDAAKQFREFHGGMLVAGEPVLLVQSAGNDSLFGDIPARFNAPRAYAALVFGWPHVIVVEAASLVSGVPRRALFSNPGGHLSAPGGGILSTVPPNAYGIKHGTSMAAPFVTGLVAYLLAVDPALSHADLLGLLLDNALPVAPSTGTAGSNMVDAFATVMDVDRVRGNRDVLRMLLDIDDGTPDGNQRTDPETGEDYLETDADGNGGVGDGTVDMSDFRRWRDLFLAARNKETPVEGLSLDGSSGHAKRDLNGDGVVTGGAEPYPLADFNGDGVLDPEAVWPVAGALGGEPRSDIEVLQELFFDFVHEKEDLPNLVFSGDLTVDASILLEDAGGLEVWSSVENEFGRVEAILHSNTGAVGVYTLASDDGPYTVTAYRRSAAGDTTCLSRRTVDVAPGEDEYWKPFCPGMDIDITLADFVTPGVSTPLQVRAGIRQADGAVAYKAGIRVLLSASGGTVGTATAETDGSGFVTSTATLSIGQPELVVTVIADDPESDASAAATAIARPIISGDGRVVIQSGSPAWYVDARNQSGTQIDIQTDSAQDALSYSGNESASTIFMDGEFSANAESNAGLSGAVSNLEGQPFSFIVGGSASASVNATEDGCRLSQACANGNATILGGVSFGVTDTMSYAFDATYEGFTSTSLPGHEIVLWDNTETVSVRIEQGAGKASGQLLPGRSYSIQFKIQLSSHYITTPSVQASGSLSFFVF